MARASPSRRSALSIFFYVPNLIGYARVVLTALSMIWLSSEVSFSNYYHLLLVLLQTRALKLQAVRGVQPSLGIYKRKSDFFCSAAPSNAASRAHETSQPSVCGISGCRAHEHVSYSEFLTRFSFSSLKFSAGYLEVWHPRILCELCW